jgi:DNA polymerase III epsilon subunit-like protein
MYHPYPDDRAKAIGRAQTYMSLNPLFLDTETTGLSDMHEICEIAVVDLQGSVLINTLVQPTRPIDHSTSLIHGITDEMVASAPTFRELLPQLEQILRGREVLVYNKEFDMGKIAQSARANGCGFADGDAWYWVTSERAEDGKEIYRSLWHCAMYLYANYYGDWNEYHENYRWQRLSSAALQCGIEMPLGTHRAHQDAELTRLLMLYVAGQGKDYQTSFLSEENTNGQQ